MLTGTERALERDMIGGGAWPHFPILPVVNRDKRGEDGWPLMGIITWRMGIENGPVKVYSVNMFEIADRVATIKREQNKTDVTWAEALEGVEVAEYTTLDEFFDDGWQGD